MTAGYPSEEPIAGKPHDGVCGGKSQQWLDYPTTHFWGAPTSEDAFFVLSFRLRFGLVRPLVLRLHPLRKRVAFRRHLQGDTLEPRVRGKRSGDFAQVHRSHPRRTGRSEIVVGQSLPPANERATR